MNNYKNLLFGCLCVIGSGALLTACSNEPEMPNIPVVETAEATPSPDNSDKEVDQEVLIKNIITGFNRYYDKARLDGDEYTLGLPTYDVADMKYGVGYNRDASGITIMITFDSVDKFHELLEKAGSEIELVDRLVPDFDDGGFNGPLIRDNVSMIAIDLFVDNESGDYTTMELNRVVEVPVSEIISYRNGG